MTVRAPQVEVCNPSVQPDHGRRVLIVVQNLPVPFDRRVWLEATTLRRAGYTVSVISPQLKQCTRAYEHLQGIDVYRYPLPFQGRGAVTFAAEFIWCFLWTAALSVRVHRRRGFDVLHACNPPDTYWLLGLLWRLAGKAFVFDHHDLCPEMYEVKFSRRGGVLQRMLVWFERRSFRSAAVVIAPNESHAEIARTRGHVPADRTFIVRSGPDTERLQVSSPAEGLKQGRRFLCTYLGEMCVQDGVDHLVRVARTLCVDRGRSDILFAFLGGGPEQPALVKLAERLGIRGHCDFTGQVSDEDLCRYLSTTDVAIDPTPRNPWSDRSTMNKIMEYMFFGCPIVAFDLRESMRSAGEAALYVAQPVDDVLADRIESLLADDSLRARMSAYARDRVRSHLMWDHSAPHLLAAYQRVFALK
jgi:glycosyltransferase involved in cell wall biosynthesis